jgi:hypothetical protein
MRCVRRQNMSATNRDKTVKVSDNNEPSLPIYRPGGIAEKLVEVEIAQFRGSVTV